MTNPSNIPPDYQRPAQDVIEMYDGHLYYMAEDPRSGATQLYSVYEITSAAQRCLSNGSYLQDAMKITQALRTQPPSTQPTMPSKPGLPNRDLP